MCFVLGQISPVCWVFAWPETVPGSWGGAGKAGPALAELEGFKLQEG